MAEKSPQVDKLKFKTIEISCAAEGNGCIMKIGIGAFTASGRRQHEI